MWITRLSSKLETKFKFSITVHYVEGEGGQAMPSGPAVGDLLYFGQEEGLLGRGIDREVLTFHVTDVTVHMV